MKMKILLVQRMEYLYGYGGAHKANRIMMEWFAKHGHECMVITPEDYMEGYPVYFKQKQENGEIEVIENSDQLTAYTKEGVQVFMVKGNFRVFSFIKGQVQQFHPDIMIVSEEKTHLLMEAVLELNIPTVYIAHSQTVLPFGPEAFERNDEQVVLYQKFDGIISVSHYLADYFKQWGNLKADTLYFPSYGEGPFPNYGSFDNQYITAINPSVLKGLPIIVGLARRFPSLQFLAVLTWRRKEEEINLLKSVKNITIMEAVDDVNIIYKQTKIFIMPSLWGESFGQVVVEAMLRGIPVMASEVGGLPEAKQHIAYILPVNPIREYKCEVGITDKEHLPIVPEQNIEPWVEVLEKLTTDCNLYEQLSKQSREKANEFYDKLSFQNFEAYYEKIISARKEDNINSKAMNTTNIQEKMNQLSENKKKQLYEMLRKRGHKS